MNLFRHLSPIAILFTFFAACAPATPLPPAVSTFPAPQMLVITYTPVFVTATGEAGTPGRGESESHPYTQTPTLPYTPTPTPTLPPTHTPIPLPSATPLPPTRSPSAPAIGETTITLSTYPWDAYLQSTSPGDPIYPYPRLGYDPNEFVLGSPSPRNYKAVILENSFVRLTFLPELGGRLYSWQDKTTGRQLLYNNPVIKPTGWGYRGWWLAVGGIEWSFPVIDHGFVEWRPWQYTTKTTLDAASVTLSTTEDRTGLQVEITVALDSTHSYFALTPALRNPTGNAQAFQFWITAMAAPAGDNRAGSDLRFDIWTPTMQVYSTDDKSLSLNEIVSWPVTQDGRDLSAYGNWRKFLSLFAYPSAAEGYMGVYAPRADQGFVRSFNPLVTRGIKLFGAADLPSFVWTDDDSSYVEVWGGITPNFSASAVLQAGEVFSWTEIWYPFHGVGNFVWADSERALSVSESGDAVTVGVYTTSAQSLQVVLFAGGQEVQRWTVTTTSPSEWKAAWTRTVSGALGVQVLDSSGSVAGRYGGAP